MSEFQNEKSEEEIAASVADALIEMGFSASSQNTGGGICCVILRRKGGGEIIWGTADFNWGAVVLDVNGEITSSVTTKCPSDSRDIQAIVEAIKSSSTEAEVIS